MNKKKLNWFKSTSVISIIILVIITVILGSIKITKVYKFDGSGEFMFFNNGLIVFTKDNTILKISDFKSTKTVNFNKINLKLYADKNLITEVSDEFLMPQDLNEYLEKVTINIVESTNNEKIFTKKTKEKLLEEGKFKMIITSDDETIIEENIQLRITRY